MGCWEKTRWHSVCPGKQHNAAFLFFFPIRLFRHSGRSATVFVSCPLVRRQKLPAGLPVLAEGSLAVGGLRPSGAAFKWCLLGVCLFMWKKQKRRRTFRTSCRDGQTRTLTRRGDVFFLAYLRVTK